MSKTSSRAVRVASALGLLLMASCMAEMDDVASEQSSVVACGGLRSGEQLRSGESVQSCNGRANLVHQTDGNVVEYGGGAVLFSTGTWGRGSTRLVMQSDGNLVLYDAASRPLWYTSTHGNPGAWLAVKDDCNLVIYSTANRVLWTTNRACPVQQEDLLPYFRNTRSKTQFAGDGSIVGYSQTADGNTWWYRKWTGAPKKFEKYTATANMIYLSRDTSWAWRGSDGVTYDGYDSLDGFPLAKRFWPEGEAIEFSTRLKPFKSDTCAVSNERPVHGWYRRIQYHRNKCWGGDVGCVDSIAITSAFLDNKAQPREVHWYAKNWGWIAYQEYGPTGGAPTRDIKWLTSSQTVYPVSDTCP